MEQGCYIRIRTPLRLHKSNCFVKALIFFCIIYLAITSQSAWSQQHALLKAGHSKVNLQKLASRKSRHLEVRPIHKTAQEKQLTKEFVSDKIKQPLDLNTLLQQQSDVDEAGISPSLRYAGRSVYEPLGSIKKNEITLIDSQYSQRGINRWGDYSAMTLDPVDDCTFWFTGLYVGSGQSTELSIGTWSTRIASFKFPECGGQFDQYSLNFDGIDFTGSYPADPVGDVGLNYYIQMANAPTGSVFSIYSKQDGSHIVGPLQLASLWQGEGDCKNGRGDPIVVWDQFANRWVMMELGRNLRSLCLYISVSDNPLSGGWYYYQIDTPNFPDYPKMAVYADSLEQGAYVITTNETEPAVYILNRSAMLTGNIAESQRFVVPRLSGYAFQALTPADTEGNQALEPGTPVYLLRHVDDELHATKYALDNYDFIELWSIDLGFKSNSDARISGYSKIPIAEYESELCGTVSTGCFGQAETGTSLDPLFEVMMWRVTLRNFGSKQVLLGNFSVDANGHDQGGIRWFDLRKKGGGLWKLHQQGTHAPDKKNRWMGSIAMDIYENIALGYSVSAADPPIVDTNEPDNDFSAASIIECSAQNVTALISADDVDYFLLQAVPGYTASIDIDAAVDSSSLDSLLGVFSSNFQLLQLNDTGLAGDEKLITEDSFLVQTIPEDGRLFISVGASGDNTFSGMNGGSSGFYRLSVNCAETKVDSFEPNNSFQTAAEVMCPIETLDTAIDAAFDFDYFRFVSLSPGQTITFNLDTTNSTVAIDLELRIFNSAGQLITKSDSVGSDSSIMLQVPADGELFVLVAASNLTDTGEYLLSCVQ